MYTPRSELAPALDWMLQSAQVSDEALTETLVRDYAAPLAQLAALLLPGSGHALEAVRRTITRGVLERRRYSGGSSARAWLYTLALQECGRGNHSPQPPGRALERSGLGFRLPSAEADSHVRDIAANLSAAQALVAYLTLAHGLSADDLAHVLRLPLEQAQTLLDSIARSLDQHHQHCGDCALRPGGLAEIEGRLRSAWQAAGHGPGAPDLQRLTADILARVTSQRRRQRALSHLPELAVVGALMAAMFALGWLSNRYWLKPENTATAPVGGPATALPGLFFQYSVKPGDTLESIAQKAGTSVNLILLLNVLPPRTELYPGQLLILPISQPRVDRLTPAPFTPLPLPPLLSWQSSLHDILQRAYSRLNYWHSLWADVQIIQYGLPGSVGPPQSVTRKQVWLLQPAYSRVIYGPADAEPSGTYVIVKSFENLTSDLVIDPDLQALFSPSELYLKNGQFRVAGQEPVAGRPAMMLDWQNTNGGRIYRYWIDAQYGVVLRRREYGGANFSAVLDDITVNDIAYDVAMPLTLFDPQAYAGNHFALDYTGATAAAARQPLPSQAPSPLPTAPAGHEALPF